MKVLIGLAVAAAAMAQQPQAARGQERLPVTEEGVASFYGWNYTAAAWRTDIASMRWGSRPQAAPCRSAAGYG